MRLAEHLAFLERSRGRAITTAETQVRFSFVISNHFSAGGD
jgi:hypothetical protein